jgi:uncharacterized protein YehS (DUF1456 family)
MKIIFSIIFLFTSLFAITKDQVYSYYKAGAYEKACKYGAGLVRKERKDENYLSIVTLSCVNADYLNTSITIVRNMKNTPIGRNNASYVSSLFLIKKLLMQFVYDDTDLTNLTLPKSPHILSTIFEAISHNKYRKDGDKYIIDIGKHQYTMEKFIDNKTDKILLKKQLGPKIVEQHIYW